MESQIIQLLDYFGTAVFAVTGAVKGVQSKLDIFGVTVLACCVGVGGGMVRDCIIGDLPVAVLRNEMYLIISVITGIVIFFTSRYWYHMKHIIQVGDAIGLGVFTFLGAAKGYAFELGGAGVLLCGVFTAIGGGVIRDVFVGTVPAVLKSDLYATAALIGSAVYFTLKKQTELPYVLLFLIVFVLVTGMRLLALHYHLQLPGSKRVSVFSAKKRK